MLAGLKIIVDVVLYRLRKLEMANLAAGASIGWALHLPLLELSVRTLFAFVLNVLVYLNNDYVDVVIDLHSSDKDNEKTRFLHDHMRAALVAQWSLALILVLASLYYDAGLLIPIVVGGGICVWYSAILKRRPFLDIPAMMIWGLAMPLCGFPWQSALGWVLALQLGLFSGVFESIQVMRDADEDAAEGIVTTGVRLGKAKTLALSRGLMVVSTVYAALVVHPIAGVASATALAVPFSVDDIARYWTRVKLAYGLVWLFMCVWVFLHGGSSGLLLRIGAMKTR